MVCYFGDSHEIHIQYDYIHAQGWLRDSFGGILGIKGLLWRALFTVRTLIRSSSRAIAMNPASVQSLPFFSFHVSHSVSFAYEKGKEMTRNGGGKNPAGSQSVINRIWAKKLWAEKWKTEQIRVTCPSSVYMSIFTIDLMKYLFKIIMKSINSVKI